MISTTTVPSVYSGRYWRTDCRTLWVMVCCRAPHSVLPVRPAKEQFNVEEIGSFGSSASDTGPPLTSHFRFAFVH
jgi:hypothetical protein